MLASRTISAMRTARRRTASNCGIVMARDSSGTIRPARLKHFSSVKCNKEWNYKCIVIFLLVDFFWIILGFSQLSLSPPSSTFVDTESFSSIFCKTFCFHVIIQTNDEEMRIKFRENSSTTQHCQWQFDSFFWRWIIYISAPFVWFLFVSLSAVPSSFHSSMSFRQSKLATRHSNPFFFPKSTHRQEKEMLKLFSNLSEGEQ